MGSPRFEAANKSATVPPKETLKCDRRLRYNAYRPTIVDPVLAAHYISKRRFKVRACLAPAAHSNLTPATNRDIITNQMLVASAVGSRDTIMGDELEVG